MFTRQFGYGVLLQPWIPAIPAVEGKWIEAPKQQSRETRFASSERIQTKAEDHPDRLSSSVAFHHVLQHPARHPLRFGFSE
jgi:hypothetical protein